MPGPVAVHVAAALLAVCLGAAILSLPKGTARHKAMGRVWVAAMAVVAVGSFWLEGIAEGGGFSAIHILSAVTVVSLAYGIAAIRRGRVRAHRTAMTMTFVGLTVAGVFTLMPGRMLGRLVIGW